MPSYQILRVVEHRRLVFIQADFADLFRVQVFIFLEPFLVVPLVDEQQTLVARLARQKVIVHLLSFLAEPRLYKMDHVYGPAILPDLPLFSQELCFEDEKSLLLSDYFLFITKTKIQVLIVDIAAILALVLRFNQVLLLHLLAEDALAIVFDFDIRATLDGERVLRVQIVYNIFIDAPVLLNIALLKHFIVLDYVLIEAMLLRF